MTENTENKAATATVALDEETISYLGELERVGQSLQQELQKIHWQAEAAVQMFIRRQNLEGNWRLRADKMLESTEVNGK